MLSSLGMIKETGEDEFASSQTSKNLSIPEIQAGLYHKYEALCPILFTPFFDLSSMISVTMYLDPPIRFYQTF